MVGRDKGHEGHLVESSWEQAYRLKAILLCSQHEKKFAEGSEYSLDARSVGV